MADGRDPNLGKPLIRITTDLKSLKYTLVSDTTGKTLGKDPYVTKSIPNHRVESTIVNGVETSELIVDPAPPAADGIIQSRVDDLTRFRKLALENPGQKFARNQALLGQNPLQIAKTAASILAQVPVNGTGTHFINGFVVDTYLQKDAGQGTALGRFLASNLGINNLNGAGRALQGKQIIADNDGQKNYRSQSPSKLLERNSKFDLTPGSDQDDFISPLLNQYLRSDIVALGKSVANTIKGLFSKNQKDKQAGKKPDLANIFKVNPDNLGQEGFRTEKEEDAFDYESIKSNLKSKESPDKFVQSGFEDVEGRPLIKGTPEGENAKIISDNDGGRGFTPNAVSFLEKKESTQTINVKGQALPIRPTSASLENTESFTLKKDRRTGGLPLIPENRGEKGFNNDRYGTLPSGSGISPDQFNIDPTADSYTKKDGRTISKDSNTKGSLIIPENRGEEGFNNDRYGTLPSGSGISPDQSNIDPNTDSYINTDVAKFIKGTPENATAIVLPHQDGRGQPNFSNDRYSQYNEKVRLDNTVQRAPVSYSGSSSQIPSYYRTAYITDDRFNQSDAASTSGAGQAQTDNVDGRLIVLGTPKGQNAKIVRDNPLTGSTEVDGYNGDFVQAVGTFSAEGVQQTPKDKYLTDYTKSNIEVRLGLANGESPKNGKSFIGTKQSDFVNAADIQTVNDTVGSATREYFDSDIIPFEIISVTPQQQNFLYFRVFLDSLSDNYTGNWSGNKFIGRAEEFYTYQGFKRDISFSFKIAAFTKDELIPLYKKLNYLASTTAPTYNSAGSFMRGTLTEITLGDYLYRQEGFMSSIGLSWETGYPWEIDLDNEQLPKVPTILNVDCSFTPIHKFNATSTPNFRNEVYIGGEKLSV